MSHGFEVQILLAEPRRPDLPQLADDIAEQFPMLGAPAISGAGRLIVDGAPVEIRCEPARCRHDPTRQTLRPVRAWDPTDALIAHRAHISVRCSGAESGLSWMRAYATVATISAGLLLGQTEGLALYFPASEAFLPMVAARAAVNTAIRSVSPLDAWVSFYAIAPANLEGDGYRGAATGGLLPFLGHEIELAPLPIDAQAAIDRLRGVVWMALDGDEPLTSGTELSGPMGARGMAVRQAPEWLRPGIPALVLVGAGSIVDAATLDLKAAGGRGAFALPRGLPKLASLIPRRLLRRRG